MTTTTTAPTTAGVSTTTAPPVATTTTVQATATTTTVPPTTTTVPPTTTTTAPPTTPTTPTTPPAAGFELGDWIAGGQPGGQLQNGASLDGNELVVDGADDFLEIDHGPSVKPTVGSLSLWFRADGVSGDQGLASSDSSDFDTGGHFTLLLRNNILWLRIQTAVGEYQLQGGSVSAGVWSEVRTEWGGDTVRLLVDGQVVDTEPIVWSPDGNENPWAFGASLWKSADNSSNGATHHFAGRIRDIRIQAG